MKRLKSSHWIYKTYTLCAAYKKYILNKDTNVKGK